MGERSSDSTHGGRGEGEKGEEEEEEEGGGKEEEEEGEEEEVRRLSMVHTPREAFLSVHSTDEVGRLSPRDKEPA